MSDLEVLSLDPAGLAESLRARLADRFRIAARVRVVEPERSYRVYQIREPRNRQLADVRGRMRMPTLFACHRATNRTEIGLSRRPSRRRSDS